MNALTQPIATEQPLSNSQHDLHNARSLLEATLRSSHAGLNQMMAAAIASEDRVISRFGDVQIRIEVAAALLERAEDFVNSHEDATETRIAIAEAHLASAEAQHREQRRIRTHRSTHCAARFAADPLRWKLQVISFRLNGIHPQVLQSPQREPFDGP
jgi:hypothetical protein